MKHFQNILNQSNNTHQQTQINSVIRNVNVSTTLYLVLWIFLLSVIKLILPAEAKADENNILGVYVLSETLDETTFGVAYNYTGNYGSNVFISVVMANDREPSQHYAYVPGRVQVGKHRTKVVLGTNDSAPKSFTTNQILIKMYDGNKTFLSRLYNYTKTWSKAGAELSPALFMLKVKPTLKAIPMQIENKTETKTVQRRIIENGRVEIKFPNGTIKQKFEGGFTVIEPDGKETTYLYSQAQVPTPPGTPPNNQHLEWVKNESDKLLNIIETLVENDEDSINNYLQNEGTNISYYQKITSRRTAVQFLLNP